MVTIRLTYKTESFYNYRQQNAYGEGAHDTETKAIGKSAPTQGSIPRCSTYTSGVSLVVFLTKKNMHETFNEIGK